ncbi:MAG: hypothetical protein KKB20_02125 [Proteobacteria bacterium]|nr:hypothetical protein [Pseudomonadota bacterium]
MMIEVISPINKRSPGNLRFLVCDPLGVMGHASSSEEEWVRSPVQCLDRAVDGNPGIIVILFREMPIRNREALLELAAVLKRNSHTRKSAIIALLDSCHRRLIEDLGRANVDYVRIVGESGRDYTQMREIIDGLGPGDRVVSHLAVICPFLHHTQDNSQYEMTVCGAYLDRMVLGGSRLRQICETKRHLQCEYYLKPRIRS